MDFVVVYRWHVAPGREERFGAACVIEVMPAPQSTAIENLRTPLS